jgi:hypothetical protein
MSPRAYVVAHAGSRVVNDCCASLEQYDWPYEVVAAVDGHTVTAETWHNIGIRLSAQGKMLQRPGAQGCWISHYQLWAKCCQSNQPIIILEHDAVVTDFWPDNIELESNLVKLYTTAECKVNPAYGLWSKGAHAYTITPQQAAQLIQHSRLHGAQAVDKHLGSQVLNWTFYSQDLVVLNPNRGPSSTSPKRKTMA